METWVIVLLVVLLLGGGGLGLLALALAVCPLAPVPADRARLASGTREPVGPGRCAGAGTL
jgi:hypothetical protein